MVLRGITRHGPTIREREHFLATLGYEGVLDVRHYGRESDRCLTAREIAAIYDVPITLIDMPLLWEGDQA